MAIRMREWASAPGIQPGGVVVPMRGVASIGEAGKAMAYGLQGAAEGVRSLVGLAQKVSVTGELSAFHEKLVEADAQTKEELKGRGDVGDYAGAWSQASERRIAEAMQHLSEPARAQAEEMVRDFRSRGLIEAVRTGELRALDRARSQWEAGVRQAAMRGDSAAVERHLAGGTNVFVPAKAVEEVKAQALDAACLSRWSRLWDDDPVQAMEAMKEGGEQPAGEGMRVALKRMNEEKSRAFRNDFASMLAEMDARGAVMEPGSLQRAQKLGLMDAEQTRLYTAGHAPEAKDAADDAALSRWKQRIDTMGENDAALADIRIGVAASGLPREARQKLFERVETARQLPRRERSMIDERLERYCREGYLGAPGDAGTWLRKSRLQDEMIGIHARQGVEAAIERLEAVVKQSSGWVCYSGR